MKLCPSQFTLRTPLGEDLLRLTSFEGTEAISRPFDFDVAVAVEFDRRDEVDVAKLLGKWACIDVESTPSEGPKTKRHLHGMTSTFEEVGFDSQYVYYRMRLAPKLSLLGLNSTYRVFQNASVLDIVSTVFEDYRGAFGSEFSLKTNRVNKEVAAVATPYQYCVQYEETDLEFVSRLLEAAGVFYFFWHEADSHVMVLGNATNVPKPSDGTTLRYQPMRTIDQTSSIWRWSRSQTLRPAGVTLRDRSFQYQPRSTFKGSADMPPSQVVGGETLALDTVSKLGDLRTRRFDSRLANRFEPFATNADSGPMGELAESLATIESERYAVESITIRAESNVSTLLTGHTFDFSGYPSAEGSYLVTEINHQLLERDGESLRKDSDGGHDAYRNRFRVIPAGMTFRPEVSTPRPRIQGTQSATVIGSSGDEEGYDQVFTEEHARVRIRFHWMQEGQSTAWVRVAQPSAGKGFGSMTLPRLGQEVLVSFLDGDPDCPVIVGSLYNAEQRPPFNLPAERSLSGFRTQTIAGESDGVSELLFDDTLGNELVRLHAERDLHIRAETDRFENVGRRHTLNIGFDVPEVSTLGGGIGEAIARVPSRSNSGDDSALAPSKLVGPDNDVTYASGYEVNVSGQYLTTVTDTTAGDENTLYELTVQQEQESDDPLYQLKVTGGEVTETIKKNYTLTVEGDYTVNEQSSKQSKWTKFHVATTYQMGDLDTTIRIVGMTTDYWMIHTELKPLGVVFVGFQFNVILVGAVNIFSNMKLDIKNQHIVGGVAETNVIVDEIDVNVGRLSSNVSELNTSVSETTSNVSDIDYASIRARAGSLVADSTSLQTNWSILANE
ncbi:Phage-related baseplate assembly protein [Planctomycetes bacterium Pan216]|uniref:Phage-related baseplate assembly protein n=1 Tax=Kolteria novifilia TaxID=2527975 RepID=A0A518B0F8_9BACT|nr:Phage-related baseplate assembly protein [Planctomycetes bacterium Pan216]